ncbi:hypothetical protein [Marinithermus hydrothermalis]|uniref:Uncharacterized protein n=1 Tax=Marinithermus hydrothermalis (strain DSM 14884 / JCM 11576 / T1) TaxID=869210 RepID=F2NP70_MARHT|nr:hypothetical protein [Marinithermus hydrothermalis]AEB11871.1 hypothetical protein Marky_1130 [Marinithermus hydrothermalis DSM 14884]
MSLDDLIGLLFLLIFVVAPALTGLLRGGGQRPAPPVGELFPVEAEPEPVPKPSPIPPKPKEVRQAPPPPIPKPPEPAPTPPMQPRVPPPQPRAEARVPFGVTRDHLLNGIVWHEILGEPVGQRWRHRRRRKGGIG